MDRTVGETRYLSRRFEPNVCKFVPGLTGQPCAGHSIGDAIAPSSIKEMRLPSVWSHTTYRSVDLVASVQPSVSHPDSKQEPVMSRLTGDRFLSATGYLFFMLLTVGILIRELNLVHADFHAPFEYRGDALLILPLVKATLERGSHWRNERLGLPGVQELHDFPVVDHLHFAIIWLMGQVIPDPFVVFNLYYLLTYPLTTLTAMFALRRVGLSLSAAGCGGLLYSFLPYHLSRGQVHYFLAGYYVVPLTLMVTLWICKGRIPFFRPAGGVGKGDNSRGQRLRDALTAVVVGVATGSAGAYYAFFGCALLAFAGLCGWVSQRTWRAAGSAVAVVGVVILTGIANHAPTFVYHYQYGRNSLPMTRESEQVDRLGFKFAHLVLPVDLHRIPALDRLKSAYSSPVRPLENENRSATLGAVGTIGLLALLAVLLLPGRRSWPLGPLATLAGFILLLGVMGGLGSLFAFLVSPQVRAYNRVSVYLAFLALAAFWWLADRVFADSRSWVRRLRLPVFLGIAVMGVYDQTSLTWVGTRFDKHREVQADWFYGDRTYFGEVERVVPGGAVFTLPYYSPYPEITNKGHLVGYEHANGYLHTRTVRWSYGAMEGREADQWQREVANAPTDVMLRRVVLQGFDGLHIDRRLYQPGDADRVLAELTAQLGPDTRRAVHPDGTRVFFDLRSHRERLRAELGGRYEAEARREAETVRVLWLDGFWPDQNGYGCGRSGEMQVVNPSDRPRMIRIEMVIRTETSDTADLKVTGEPVWTDRFPVNNLGLPISRSFVVPPGRHAVRFRCRPPATYRPTDSRRLIFFLKQIRVEEVTPAGTL
jgi:hypothetical protein